MRQQLFFAFLFVFVCVVPSAGFAQSIVIDLGTGAVTINPSAGQVTAIQRLTDRDNAQRAAQKVPLPAITREEWVRDKLVATVQSYLIQAREHNANDACDNYNKASGATKNQIDTALGGKSPCR